MNLEHYRTNDGRDIYRFPIRAFPVLTANIHLIDDGDHPILVDCGSGLPESNDDLLAGLAAIKEQHGRAITLADLGSILITHGHIDHFGGLSFVRKFTSAPIAIHQLDLRVLANYEERRIVAARRLEIFLEQAGIVEKYRQALMEMYLYAKDQYQSVPISTLLEEGVPYHGMDVYHVPGHCPGQVCLQLDNIMLTTDHILSRITPHQSPESITLNMGLSHYFDSLDKIKKVPGIELGLGGHETPIPDVYGRIEEIKQAHYRRLEKVLAICDTPKNIAQISQELFGRRESYHILLALAETGAHVEYLYDRGALIAANLEEIAVTPHPVIQYVAT